ncbi:MAG: chromosomal replication initiator protein DnaA, partial [Thermodesulfobacteriota bacterium]
MEHAWEKIQNNLQKSLKSGIFQVWIKPLQGQLQDKTLFLSAPNEFVASWIRDRLQDKIQKAAADILGYRPELRIQGLQKKSFAPLLGNNSQNRMQLPVQYEQSCVKPKTWRFSFEDFVVGDCNQLAYAACTSLCRTEFPAGNLFLCSGPGLGKTHLLQAIGNQVCQSKKQECINVSYLSSEQFASQMVQALKNKEIDKFKSMYREQVDLLLLEDIHFFQGKAKMQEELLSLIKSLESKGNKVVFTSSFLPKELDKVDSQLSSYFCSGLLAPINKPNQDLRLRLVKQKSKHFQIDIPDDICKMVADSITSDIRQLESCIQNMALKARLLKQNITQNLAQEVLQNYSQEKQTQSMESIAQFVCKAFELPVQKLRSKSRKKQVVLARNTAFYLARKYTELSLKDIGEHFNRRHSTVLKGITNVEKEISRDSSLGRQVAQITD